MNTSLQDKIVLITGGSEGIGAATARSFADAGCQVYIADVQPPVFELAANVHYLHCDVRHKSDLMHCAKMLLDNHARIDICVANAGVHDSGSLLETPDAVLDNLIQINLKGTIYTLQSVLPAMQAQQAGQIVLVGSDQSHVAKHKCAIYGATKAAIAHLAKSTALDFMHDNIRVNAVCPGSVRTAMYDNAVASYAKATGLTLEATDTFFETHIPIQRVARPNEIANVIKFLCTEDAAYITGTTLNVDGGYTAV